MEQIADLSAGVAGLGASGWTGDTPAVRCEGLTKDFGEQRAVDRIDLTVPRGSVFGFLGPNGAGKTTTIRILATLSRPSGGQAQVLGHDVVSEAAAVRRKISLISQFASVDQDLTATENLVLAARLLGYSWSGARKRAAGLLDAFGLSEAADRQASAFSGGLRRRLDIAASLIVTPELLFLDEPTTGLDPRNRLELWDLIRAVAAAGTTVLLTTQYLEEADQLADRIAVIDSGRIIADGSRDELKSSIGEGSLRLNVPDADQRGQAAKLLEDRLGVSVDGEAGSAALTARLAGDGDELGGRAAAVVAELTGAGVDVRDFSYGHPSLDEVFLALTGKPAEHGNDGGEG
ncbi:MAG TPA: ATP-binding cassette domain-containing protein [Solirubrobacterales bacterium]